MAQQQPAPKPSVPATTKPLARIKEEEETRAPPPSPLRRVDVPRLFLSREALDSIAERTPTPRPPRCPEESESPSSE